MKTFAAAAIAAPSAAPISSPVGCARAVDAAMPAARPPFSAQRRLMPLIASSSCSAEPYHGTFGVACAAERFAAEIDGRRDACDECPKPSCHLVAPTEIACIMAAAA